ncbi:MAG TPA: alpha/beta hydrolase [Planctomycetaceae bacterium]|nr:alpha/beta hydrolase [Planctomycetaceae bacterium]
MATQDAGARLHEIMRERSASGGLPAAECCGASEEPRPHDSLAVPEGGGTAAVCPEDREPCPAPLTASEVVTRMRADAPLWTLEHGGRTILGRTFGVGPPLYLLNGLTGTLDLYALLAWVLREHVRCVMFDWPVERSGTRRRREPLDAFAGDLIAVADLHGDERFAVYGPSFGGLVALAAMLDRPERIERAVLHGAFASRRLSVFERLLAVLGRTLPGTLARVPLCEAILRQNRRPWFPPFDAARFQFLLDDTGRTAIRTLARRAGLMRRTDLRPRLREITRPVLLVHTEGEGAVSARAQNELTAAIPDVRTEWLHTCGQLPHLTHPHRLAKLLRSFLEDASGPSVLGRPKRPSAAATG